jgi:ATP-dependent Clp protease ATP-binding subunit ClpX
MLILRKKKPDTSLLIAGIDAHICDKCEQAHGLFEELKSTGSSKLAGDLI